MTIFRVKFKVWCSSNRFNSRKYVFVIYIYGNRGSDSLLNI